MRSKVLQHQRIPHQAGQYLALVQGYHHCVWPQASWRQALAEPIATQGTGSAKGWRPSTPALAAGWTDHVWSLTAVGLSRVPPGPQPQTVAEALPGDEQGIEQLTCAQREARRCGRGLKTCCAC